MMKMFINDPQPYYMEDIHCYQCIFDYGNPSLTATLSVSIYVGGWDVLCRQYKVRPVNATLSFICVLAFIVFTGLSLFYTGNAAYNQVLNGWFWGFIIYQVNFELLHFELCKLSNRVKEFVFSAKKTQNYIYATTFLYIYVVELLVVFVLLKINSELHPMPDEWK